MLTVFYESSGQAGLNALQALLLELQTEPQCQSARLLEHTQEATYLIISEWHHAPEHPLPAGVRRWAFRELEPL